MEGAATTVYAQGGRGNSRLVAWEGERTVTFTMEDALISPAGFMILSGAGLVDGKETPIQVHQTEQTDKVYVDAEEATKAYIITEEALSTHSEATIYAMVMNNGEISTEPYIGSIEKDAPTKDDLYFPENVTEDKKTEVVAALTTAATEGKLIAITNITRENNSYAPTDIKTDFGYEVVVMLDYYAEKKGGAQQIEITPDKFGGNYYLEASTLFRNTDGVDMPAEFIIPNCKIQSNFTFTMASSGDPSTFTFTMDAFPDYTRFDKTKKVLAAIQIISDASGEGEVIRESTSASHTHGVNADGIIFDKTVG